MTGYKKIYFDEKKIKMNLSVFESKQMVEGKSFDVWKFDEHHKVDIRGTINEPYFNGNDVCEILGYKKLNEVRMFVRFWV